MVKFVIFLEKNLIFLTRGEHRFSLAWQGFWRGK